ncbi:MAG: mannose-1-phosphate guanylyltransferase/mannose-6-phosphate isomerase, partial [Rhizobiales bacterium]|nr:mannose-1-phosphate guanylyltransferase/mannose-6-phosphate isomerase [Hyphomicrobiales bacterium]
MIFPVILSGGAGTRLWPLSRSGYPKQFLPLTGKRTLFQQTLVRLEGLNCAPSIFICNETHRFLVAEQISQVDVKHNGIILEPIARDTGPAIALAAIHALNKDADAMLLVLPTDHIIENITEFHDAVNIAMQHAQDDKLVTFGIVPDKPETGYGYIKRGQAYNNAFKVNEFVEKPNIITAIDYITSKNYYWNSGMFMFKAARYLEILKQYCPSIYNVCKNALNNQVLDLDFIRINEEEFSDCPSKSVDFAVMEPAAANEDDHVIVVPLNAGWRDIGSFNALLEVSQLDEHGNSFMGDVKAINTQNTLIRAETRLIATVGVEDLIIIDTKDSLLIAHKAHAQDV